MCRKYKFADKYKIHLVSFVGYFSCIIYFQGTDTQPHKSHAAYLRQQGACLRFIEVMFVIHEPRKKGFIYVLSRIILTSAYRQFIFANLYEFMVERINFFFGYYE
jgi:hypothetical protein